MKTKIDSTKFGQITIDGQKYNNDVIIRLDGQVEKRKKKLSKAIYGTSHMISLNEAQYVYESGAQNLIIGSGHMGMVKLSREAETFFSDQHCQVNIHPTPKAAKLWNKTEGSVIGLFHITC
ncbi:MAG: hypothetical protein HPY45_01640 [Anaerolineae bacterium]|nr:hypothetical protein [Anaerolineae bacterium]